MEVSIHAPARGATHWWTWQEHLALFQFTRPQGARHDLEDASTCEPNVSIHAPARGATAFHQNRRNEKECQFTRPQGARLWRASRHGRVKTFQFTRPQGARPRTSATSFFKTGFNSRARKGRDFCMWLATLFSESFNSRARKGRDLLNSAKAAVLLFQFTRPQGARLKIQAVIFPPYQVSIHAPARGATGQIDKGLAKARFQFTRPQGARR